MIRPNKIERFTQLGKVFTHCEQLLINHQIALMHSRLEDAFATFERLYKIRIHHLEIMEHELLPVYASTGPAIPEGGKELYFIREKRLIVKELDYFIRFIGEAVLKQNKPDLVELFEKYAWLKDLLDHHDARETAFLFPVLDQANVGHLLARIMPTYLKMVNQDIFL